MIMVRRCSQYSVSYRHERFPVRSFALGRFACVTNMEQTHHSSQSSDPLRSLGEVEIRLLRECYRRGLPGTLAPFLFVDNHLRWCEKIRLNSTNPTGDWKGTVSPIVWKRFFTLAMDDREQLTTSGTFVAITDAEKCPTVVFWTLQEDLSPLKRALMETDKINWMNDPAFSCVALEHYTMVQNVLQQKAPHLEFRNSTFFRLPDSTARTLQLSLPDGYEILPLDESHAYEVNDTWPHRYAGSEEYYRSLLRLNGGLALATTTPDTDPQQKQLAGWILTNEYGALAHLFIQPAHRNRGLASVLVKAWVLQTIETWENDDHAKGSEVIAYIMDVNVASRTLFKKLGFIEMSKSRWSNPTTK
uniref:N-acetyltransferase domain-containing protein n=1 Tax=Anopheles funestus TaxID=62324 RepID=A0A182RJ47_ANOFN